ncbi:hypothetical protein KBC03_02015 [Patescibacteria group bacterium]|nr:hypothetical protein [Patescibacteria group bacterium]
MFSIRIEYAIIAALAEQKDITVQELYASVTNGKNLKVSLPNFYKIVGRMIDSQVLVKTKGRLHIHTMYLHFIVKLAENVQKTYFSNATHNVETLQAGDQQTFSASSLYDLDVIWMDILTQLIKKYPDAEGFYYNSHPYHVLSITDKEKANMEEIGSGLKKSYFLFGNTTFLDQYGSTLYSMKGYTIKCSDDVPFPEEGYFINIIGDYIIECTLPQSVAQHYQIFFDTVNSLDTFNVQMFGHIIKMKDTCSIKVIHSPEHAKKMKQKIKKFFS